MGGNVGKLCLVNNCHHWVKDIVIGFFGLMEEEKSNCFSFEGQGDSLAFCQCGLANTVVGDEDNQQLPPKQKLLPVQKEDLNWGASVVGLLPLDEVGHRAVKEVKVNLVPVGEGTNDLLCSACYLLHRLQAWDHVDLAHQPC